MTHTWTIRTYQEGDERKIFELWNALHPEKKDNEDEWLAWWNWLYKQNPAGKGIIFLATEKDNIIGQYALIPIPMKINDKKILGARAVHAMTHPSYRRQGVFETLGNTTLAYAAKNGIPVTIATTNQYSGPASLKKLEMFAVSSLRTFFYPIHWESLFQQRIHNPVLIKLCAGLGKIAQRTMRRKQGTHSTDITITRITRFDDRINTFWDDIADAFPITLIRNKDLLNWRYASVPHTTYTIFIAEEQKKIHGYIILRSLPEQSGNIGIIYDLTVHPSRRDVQRLLLSTAVEHFSKENINLIKYYLFHDAKYRRGLRQAGFFRYPQRYAQNQFIAYSSLPVIETEVLKQKQHWFIQLGNSDVL